MQCDAFSYYLGCMSLYNGESMAEETRVLQQVSEKETIIVKKSFILLRHVKQLGHVKCS